MPNLPAPRGGHLPARLNRHLARQEAQAVLASHHDALRIRRSVQAGRNGVKGIAEVGALAGAYGQEVPWVARHLESAVNMTSAVILGHIADTGY